MPEKPMSPPLSVEGDNPFPEFAAKTRLSETVPLSEGSCEPFSDARSTPVLPENGSDGNAENGDEDEGTALPPAPSFKSVLLQFLKTFATAGSVDLYTISSPAIMCSGISVLEYCAHYGDHPEILAAIPKAAAPVDRMLAVVQWYISGLFGSYASRSTAAGFERKPFNPILGEQFHAQWADEGDGATRIVAEQVSHHPPTTAFHLANDKAGVYVSAHSTQKTRFTGTSIRADQQGQIFLYIAPLNEEYLLTMPEVYVRGLLTGAPFIELCGDVAIVSSSGFGAKMRFIPKPWFSGEYDRLEAVIFDSTTGQIHFDLWGKWSANVHFGEHEDPPEGDPRRCHFPKRPVSRASDSPGSATLSPAMAETEAGTAAATATAYNPLVDDHTRTGPILFSAELMPKVPFRVTPLSKQSPNESRRVWHPVTKALMAADYDAANAAKNAIENEQRALRRERAEHCETWTPSLFAFRDFCFLPRVHRPGQGEEMDAHLTDILANLVAESPKILSANLDDPQAAASSSVCKRAFPYKGRWVCNDFSAKFVDRP
jgi:hypothetical protein